MPLVRVSPKVMEKGSRVELSCEAPHSLSGAQCAFYTHPSGEVFTQTNSSSHGCMLSVSGTELLGQRAGKPRTEVGVRCDYQERGRPRSPKSQSVTVVVWDADMLTKPHLEVPQSQLNVGDKAIMRCKSDSGKPCSFYRNQTLIRTVSYNSEHKFCHLSVSVDELLGDREFNGTTVLSVSCGLQLTLGGELNTTLYSEAKTISVTGSFQKDVSTEEPPNIQPTTSQSADGHSTTGNDGALWVVVAAAAGSFTVLAGAVFCLIRCRQNSSLPAGTSNRFQQGDPVYSNINFSPQQREPVNTQEDSTCYSTVGYDHSTETPAARVQFANGAEYATITRH
ncbi:hypothetical protein MATL_G00082100 [Megalops atlanticus]|uniref:Uncharacterized protein n=1 Tax=Megalops atlanticus TaxID=7932 RepID=A0A9D3TAQ1_MEGAT|nr:hypothetical protein MATL_G00082100 [Megalops atlanticus]